MTDGDNFNKASEAPTLTGSGVSAVSGEALVRPGERVDDLQLKGLRLIQNPKCFCFGTDAVLLADFATVKKNAYICDLGTGTGIIPVLLYGRHSFIHLDAVEIQPQMAEMARRSMLLNGIEEKITVHNFDMREIKGRLDSCKYSLVVCNPPYQKDNGGEHNAGASHAVSRHEETCTLTDVCRAASYLLKNGGRLAMVNHSDRLADIFEEMRRFNLEPKRCRPVQSSPASPAYIVLVEGVKEGKPYMNFEPALCINDENGVPTREIDRIYHRI